MFSDKQWESCPAGLIGEMVERRRRERRRGAVTRAAGWGSAALLLFVGVVVTSQFTRPSAGEITCARAAGLFVQHHEGQLDRVTRKNVDKHLDTCTRCREHYERMFSQEAKGKIDSPGGGQMVAAVFGRGHF